MEIVRRIVEHKINSPIQPHHIQIRNSLKFWSGPPWMWQYFPVHCKVIKRLCQIYRLHSIVLKRLLRRQVKKCFLLYDWMNSCRRFCRIKIVLTRRISSLFCLISCSTFFRLQYWIAGRRASPSLYFSYNVTFAIHGHCICSWDSGSFRWKVVEQDIEGPQRDKINYSFRVYGSPAHSL